MTLSKEATVRAPEVTPVPGATVVRRSRSRRSPGESPLVALGFVAPAVLLSGLLLWYPLVLTVYHSFTAWDGQTSRFVGLENYRYLLHSGSLWSLLRANVVFLLSLPLIMIICLVVSVLLYEQIAGWRFFRSIYYVPAMLSPAVVGFLFRTFFNAQGGMNSMLSGIGLGFLSQDWLESVPTAFLVLILAFYWQNLGWGVVVFLASLSAISPELVEAAALDGAGWWQRLFRVVLPQLKPAIAYFVVTNTVWIFVGMFSLVYSITGGGPGHATTPVEYQVYISGFDEGQFGYASALCLVLLIVVAVVGFIQIRMIDRD